MVFGEFHYIPTERCDYQDKQKDQLNGLPFRAGEGV